ncbi:MAG TPA: M23 family metallopeptidase [Arcobacter sp.]|jgi:murein DD-endopeptidase MepM/ murein hydrolase activator NlpD|nr:M23 family metallopeptidase [Arcobacter sp.]
MARKNGIGKFLTLLILLVIIGGGGFIYLSPQFEQNKPEITLKSNSFWNLRDKLKITIFDDSPIKYYKVIFKDNSKEIVLDEKVLNSSTSSVELQLDPPKLDMFYKGEDIQIIVEAIDSSKWNFLNGNTNKVSFDLKIDKKKPIANVVANSRYIKQAGSAIVVVKVADENLKEAYIDFSGKAKYKLTPFYKENYYVAIIPWDININFNEFTQVTLVANDMAGNISQAKIPFYIQRFKVKYDNINISEKFINQVSTNVLKQMGENVPSNLKERFIKQNHDLRAKNIETIKQIALKNISNEIITDFKIKPFKRLRGSKTAAGYGERRSYFLNGEKIDEAWHLGIDWASVRQASIKASNSGTIIFNNYLGIYGNTLIINHGMGLASLYAHTTNQFVTNGDTIYKNSKIATTGISGAVLGDHLHFGILVQGIEVNPIEWMDKNWIKTRIFDILKDAKKIIDRDSK